MGYIYAMSNKSMPGILKIGMTEGNIVYMNLKEDTITMETVQEEYKLLLFNNRDLIKN